MRFDWPTDSDFTAGQPASAGDERDRPLLPDGTHVVSIVWAGEQTKDWAIHDQDNPDGKVLTVKLDCGKQWRPLWESIRVHWRGKIEALCRSARIAPPSSGQDWSEDQLVGQFVTIETVQAVSKAGREFVMIDQWRPGPPVAQLPPVEKRVARTPAAKAHAEFRADHPDDIPF